MGVLRADAALEPATLNAAFAIGALLGLIPGAILVLLAVPVSGEIELTLGAFGIQLGALGFLIGGLLGALKG